MSNKILITGADGFIGSHLTEQLVVRGFDVRAFVYYNSQNSWGWLDDTEKKIKSQIEVVAGDIRDYECVNSAMQGCDYIFNLASLIGIPYSYKSPSSYIDTNIKGIMNIMNAAKNKSITKIIHTSTSEVYGSAKIVPMTEKHQLSAQSPYAASKIGADQLAISYNKSFDLPISILRPFNTFGPRQSLRAIIPTIITQFLDDRLKKIKIGNVNVTRDFNYIDDTVDAFISTIKAKNIIGEVINIGTGRETSIKDLLKTVGEITKSKKVIKQEKIRVRNKATEVDRLCASNLKAKKLLKWRPRFHTKSGFVEGLKMTISWFEKKENIKKFKTNFYNI
jgi:NAD dependent epimerase/dehydratase